MQNQETKTKQGVHKFWNMNVNPITMQRNIQHDSSHNIEEVRQELSSTINGRNTFIDEVIDFNLSASQNLQRIVFDSF